MSHRKLDASEKKLTLFFTLFVLIVYLAYVIFTHMSLLQFTSIQFSFLSFLFYFFPGAWQFLKGFLSPSRITDAQGCHPLGLSPQFFEFLLYIHLIIFAVFLVSLLVSFPCVFFFPLGTFPVFCLRSTTRLPHPVCPLGELGPLSHMAPGIAACNTDINNDFITAVNYGTQ